MFIYSVIYIGSNGEPGEAHLFDNEKDTFKEVKDMCDIYGIDSSKIKYNSADSTLIIRDEKLNRLILIYKQELNVEPVKTWLQQNGPVGPQGAKGATGFVGSVNRSNINNDAMPAGFSWPDGNPLTIADIKSGLLYKSRAELSDHEMSALVQARIKKMPHYSFYHYDSLLNKENCLEHLKAKDCLGSLVLEDELKILEEELNLLRVNFDDSNSEESDKESSDYLGPSSWDT